MKIALVHSFYSSRVPSGENIVVEAQAEALRNEGHDVSIVAAHTDLLENKPGYRLRTAINVMTGYGVSPLPAIRSVNPDVVHVHNLFPNMSTAWLSEWRGPIVSTLHNYRPVCAAGTLFRDGGFCRKCPDEGSHHSLMHACYRDSRIATAPIAIRNRQGIDGDRTIQSAHRIILLSERSRALYQGFGIPNEKIALIPNFVEDRGFQPHRRPGTHWLYLGRLSAEKGILPLLQHWPADQVIHIYGDGPLRDAIAPSLNRNVVYKGAVKREEIPRVLSESRGLIVSSGTPEGAVPLTHVEALAAGRPTIAISGNGAADDIAASGAGIVFDHWSQLSEKVPSDEFQIQELGKFAREHYSQNFTVRKWLDRTVGLYSDLIEEVA